MILHKINLSELKWQKFESLWQSKFAKFVFAKVENTENLLMKQETSYRRIRPPTVAENSICVDRKKLSIFWPCEIQ